MAGPPRARRQHPPQRTAGNPVRHRARPGITACPERQDGARWRRVAPSPEPVGLPDLPAIRTLLGTGAIVVCAGGGGVAVVVRDGRACGMEAVVDKDLTASLLARELDADTLLLLTDVSAVQDDYGTPQARPIRRATLAELRKRDFPAGSMGPRSRPRAASARQPESRPPSDGSPMRRPCSPPRPGPSSALRDNGDRAMRVAQHGVPDRPGPVRAGMRAAPSHDHQVGAGGQADQGPGRVAGHDLPADRDTGDTCPPSSPSAPPAGCRPPRLRAPGRPRRE
jgi:Amino acid kinase family